MVAGARRATGTMPAPGGSKKENKHEQWQSIRSPQSES